MARLIKKTTKKKKTVKDAALLAKGLKKVGGKILVNENYKRGKDPALDKVILEALIDKI